MSLEKDGVRVKCGGHQRIDPTDAGNEKYFSTVKGTSRDVPESEHATNMFPIVLKY